MKKLFLAAAFACATAYLSAAVSPEDLSRANEHLKKTSAALAAATEGLSDAQLNFKPAPNRWSVAEVAEHVAAAEDFLFGLVKADVMKAPARTEATDVKAIDEFVLAAIPDRTNKVQAPEPLIPTKRFGSVDATLKHFHEARARIVSFLNETPDLRDHAIDSPLGKKLDAYQWLLFISAHCERHTKQINEVKADPNFPKT